MNSSPSIIAVIPARKGSKGLPNKNTLVLRERPLLHYTLEAIKESRHVAHTLVITDDPLFKSQAEAYGIEVIEEPEELARDDVPIVLPFRYAVVEYEKRAGIRHNLVALCEVSTPVRPPRIIDRCLELLIASNADFVVTVEPASIHPPQWAATRAADGRIRFVNGAPPLHRQKADPLYHLGGAMDLYRRQTLDAPGFLINYLELDCAAVPYEPGESVHINTVQDAEFAEFLIARRATTTSRMTLEDLYRQAAETPSDINEHCGKLRELSGQCETVVEFGKRYGVSTVALLAGRPSRFVTIGARHDPILDVLKAQAGTTQFEYQRGTSLDADVPPCDLMFIDTKHTADHLERELERHAPRVRRWMAFHDTVIYGERGEDGGPGLLPALRRFLAREPHWRVVYHSEANHGLTVISRAPEDTPLVPCPLNGSAIARGSELVPSPTARELKELKDKHRGADIYVIGSAASMDYIDPDFFRNRVAIGCNLVFRQFPVTFSIFKEGNESQLIEAAARSAVIISRHPYGNTGYPAIRHACDFPPHYVFPHRMNQHTAVDWSVLGSDEIVVSYSTITSAIHVAAYMGARNIFLCGVDGGRLDGRLNFTGYQSPSRTHEELAWYRNWVQEILPQTLELRDRLKTVYGCRVYLLSPFLNFQLEGHRFEV